MGPITLPSTRFEHGAFCDSDQDIDPSVDGVVGECNHNAEQIVHQDHWSASMADFLILRLGICNEDQHRHQSAVSHRKRHQRTISRRERITHRDALGNGATTDEKGIGRLHRARCAASMLAERASGRSLLFLPHLKQLKKKSTGYPGSNRPTMHAS